MNLDREHAIRDLVYLRKDAKSCVAAITKFDWDFDGIPFMLDGSAVANVLSRFLDDGISPAELELWADALELREDIEFDVLENDWIHEVIFNLSSSELNGPITKSRVAELLSNRKKF